MRHHILPSTGTHNFRVYAQSEERRMNALTVSYDTRKFEVSAEFDENRQVTRKCAEKLSRVFDDAGFVVVTDFLSDDECAAGLQTVTDVASDVDRERAQFASQTDVRFRRRDFCPLPCSKVVLDFCALLARRGERILTEYCGRARSILEISTLISNFGSSHQYLHRDPPGVLCLFAALDDVTTEQGGTVFVPGTHGYSGSGNQYGGKAERLMSTFKMQYNQHIFAYNLRKLKKMRKSGEPPITDEEYWARVFSSTETDNHQPNLYRFLTGRNAVFSLFQFGPRALLKMLLYRNSAAKSFRLVQTAPKKGTLVLYRSDILHAGPDNRSRKPRYFFNINIARDIVHPKRWHDGYAPHSTLTENPQKLGNLLD